MDPKVSLPNLKDSLKDLEVAISALERLARLQGIAIPMKIRKTKRPK
jgi:hypothetical protein